MNFRRDKPPAMGFQLAPMLDVVFLLLCFFVTIQIFSRWEREVPITVPTADTGESLPRTPGEIILNIRPGGTVVINGLVHSDLQLQKTLQQVVALFPGQPVLIRADKKTDFQHVVKVLDFCRKTDIYNISFATNAPEE